MAVLIENRQNRLRLPLKRLRATAQAILDDLGCPEGELSLLMVDDPGIAELNRAFLNREGPTNVIAFSMREGAFAEVSPGLLGDVVVSVDTAVREAETAGISVEERLLQLIVHGVLHLFGFDHVQSPEEARRMEKKSSELLERIRAATR